MDAPATGQSELPVLTRSDIIGLRETNALWGLFCLCVRRYHISLRFEPCT